MSKIDISYIINELGEDRENYFNAIAPPIIQTSNFAFDKFEDLNKALQDEMTAYLYSRGINPTVDILRQKLAALDGAEDCLVFSNGAAAIFASVLANVKSGDHIVSVKAPYTWAQRTFDVILPRFGITTTYIDGAKIENWEKATQKNTTLYYLESPNSWDYAVQPIKQVAELARSKGIISIIDNSYCTPLIQRPIEMGIDLSLQTATKYIGGHSDTLGGVLSGSKEMIKKIFGSEYLNIGSGIQPFNAWLLIRGLRTLPARLERIRNSTAEVIEYMKHNQKVDSVIIPGDPSIVPCGLFTFTLKNSSFESIARFCESLQHIMMAVSWGGHESLVIPKCSGLKAGEFDPANKEHHYIRMYVGLEEPSYLINDLDQALKNS
jgi:cystathionine beta-lyase/cystathionine gamma-synthase